MQDLAIHDYFPDASRIIYGGMNLGGGWNTNALSADDIKQTQEILEHCIARKINIIDLADIYTFGKAETVVGEVLKITPRLRDKLIIQSKIGIKLTPEHAVKQYDLSAQWIKQATEASLSRLGIEQLDILFLHRPDPLMDVDEAGEALERMHKQGKFKYLAVSNMHAAQVAWLQAAVDFPIIANQLEMSLAHTGFIEETIMTNIPSQNNNGFARGTLEFCEQQNIQIQAWGSLAQGRFSNKSCAPEDAKTHKLVKQIANRTSTNPNAVVLAWLMKHPLGIQAVIGSTQTARIDACLQASKVELSREDWYALLQASRGQEIP